MEAREVQVLVGTSSVLVEEMRPEATTRIRAAKMGRTPLGMPTNAEDPNVSHKDKLEDVDISLGMSARQKGQSFKPE